MALWKTKRILILSTLCIIFLSSTVNADDEEYDYDDPVTSCESNHAYVNLELCMHECEKIQLHNNETYIYGIDPTEKMRFKVVELKSNEFKVDPNGYLLTDLPIQVPRDAFVVNRTTQIAYVCYPLDLDFVNCTKWFLEEDEFELHNNSRYLFSKRHNSIHTLGKFYIEVLSAGTEAGVCVPESVLQAKKSGVDTLYLVAYAMSVIWLILTFILAILIPELNIRKNYILLCHLVALTLAYVLLFARNIITEPTRVGCLVLALMQQFTLLASFFWINVQAIDLYMRFYNLRGTCDMHMSVRRFVIYCAYAWGFPSIICLVTLAMEKVDIQSFKPKFRINCWFDSSDPLTMFVYFYGFVAVLLLANVLLFVLTIFKLYQVGKNASNVNKKMQNQLLLLYLKLVIVMGLCWIMEVISWLAGGPKHHWYFTDLINALQGFFIFLIYVCKPSFIRRILYKNSFFPNRPKWFPWKRRSHQKPSQDEGAKSRGTLSTTTSLTGNESVQINTTSNL